MHDEDQSTSRRPPFGCSAQAGTHSHGKITHWHASQEGPGSHFSTCRHPSLLNTPIGPERHLHCLTSMLPFYRVFLFHPSLVTLRSPSQWSLRARILISSSGIQLLTPQPRCRLRQPVQTTVLLRLLCSLSMRTVPQMKEVITLRPYTDRNMEYIGIGP